MINALQLSGQQPPHRGRRLGAALAISMIAHLGLLVLVTDWQITTVTPQALHISLEQASLAGSQVPAHETSASLDENIESAASVIGTHSPQALQTPTQKQETEPSATAAARSSGSKTIPSASGDAAFDRAEVESEIHTALQARFSYPALARRHGWEGTVILRLDLDASGRLGAVRVEQSSGHRILDRAAMDALKALAEDIPLANRQNGPPLDNLLIPVIYQLQG